MILTFGPTCINKDGCPVLRLQPGWGAGEGTAFEFLPLRSAIEAAAYDAFFFWRTSKVLRKR
jgi:hypothetical protein